jgi:hypothetical protein
MNTPLSEKTTHLRRLFYIGIWAILCPFTTYGQGLITSTIVDTMPPQYFELLEKGGKPLEKKFSLRQYCPTPADQGYGNTCVAFACGHAAMTTTKQIKLPKENIRDNPYSAAYIYKNIKMNEGIEFEKVLDFMKKDGIYRVDNTQNRKGERGLTEAVKQNKMDWSKLFTKSMNLDYAKVRNTLKREITNGFPIIVGMNIISKDFQERKGEKARWQLPTIIKDTIKHAMVIVGYDDNTETFDLMNSRGIGWGSGGFIQLGYADFERVFESAYMLGTRGYSRGDNTTDSLSATIDSTLTVLIGTFQLKYRETTPNSVEFQAQALQFTEKSNESIYETKDLFKIKSQFQIHVRDIPKDKKLYVFSLDSAGSVNIHGQSDAMLEQKKGLMPIDNVVIIPASGAIGVKYKGKDQIIMLISDSTIANFKQQLDAFKTQKGTAQERLEAVFGDTLLPATAIDYRKSDDTTMSVKSRGWHAAKHSIVPIILDIRIAD